jgi:hypothetical protein
MQFRFEIKLEGGDCGFRHIEYSNDFFDDVVIAYKWNGYST